MLATAQPGYQSSAIDQSLMDDETSALRQDPEDWYSKKDPDREVDFWTLTMAAGVPCLAFPRSWVEKFGHNSSLSNFSSLARELGARPA